MLPSVPLLYTASAAASRPPDLELWSRAGSARSRVITASRRASALDRGRFGVADCKRSVRGTGCRQRDTVAPFSDAGARAKLRHEYY